jgi:response regulator RpfG family c-di-GMP phosphodiesterase
MRILLVDDDQALRTLLRATFEGVDVELEEAASAGAARAAIERERPDVIVLDVRMPGTDGIELCRELKSSPSTRSIAVALLTGSGADRRHDAETAGADAYVTKPFSPLELLGVVERLAGGFHPIPFRAPGKRSRDAQLQLYARDLRHLLEVERAQRRLLEEAYRETVAALAAALESKDFGTRAHSQRVQRYATQIAAVLDPALVEDASIEYGFVLHDVGKIGIPDSILQKRGPLNEVELRLMKTHTVLGEQMLGGVAFLRDQGLEIVRSHHERWDGAGYPDRLAGSEISLGARIFAVADTLDAMTSDRPYRNRRSWEEAILEIASEAGAQFDPTVVDAFREIEASLHEIHEEFAAA